MQLQSTSANHLSGTKAEYHIAARTAPLSFTKAQPPTVTGAEHLSAATSENHSCAIAKIL